MKPFEIVLYGNPILRQTTEPVDPTEEDLQEIVERMFLTADIYGGIGLAANQVGLLKQLYILNYRDEEGNPIRKVYLNPKILSTEGSVVIEEGCLSFPGIRLEIERPEKVRVRYLSLEGKEEEEDMDGMIARVAQHEIDHLNGIYFIDHISTIRRRLLRKKLKEIAAGKVEPPVSAEFQQK